MARSLLVLSLVLQGCLLYPSHHEIRTDAARLSIDFEGRSLRVFHRVVGDAPSLVILGLTGNGGRAEHQLISSAAVVDAAGLSARLYAVQYPGFGEDTGSSGMRVTARAVLAAARWVRARHPDATLWIHGISMGSVFGLHAASELGDEQVQGLILEKPPNLRPMILWRFGWWNLWLIAGPYALWLPTSARSDRSAAMVGDIPVLVVIARYDGVVPHDYSMQVYRALSGPKLLIDVDGGHNQQTNRASAPTLRASVRWLWMQRE